MINSVGRTPNESIGFQLGRRESFEVDTLDSQSTSISSKSLSSIASLSPKDLKSV